MGIRIIFAPVPDRVRMWSVSVPLPDKSVLLVGYVTMVAAEWRARRRGDTAAKTVYGFATRAEAATWILHAGGFARPRPAPMQVAA
jgi:hypothetical protein